MCSVCWIASKRSCKLSKARNHQMKLRLTANRLSRATSEFSTHAALLEAALVLTLRMGPPNVTCSSHLPCQGSHSGFVWPKAKASGSWCWEARLGSGEQSQHAYMVCANAHVGNIDCNVGRLSMSSKLCPVWKLPAGRSAWKCCCNRSSTSLVGHVQPNQGLSAFPVINMLMYGYHPWLHFWDACESRAILHLWLDQQTLIVCFVVLGCPLEGSMLVILQCMYIIIWPESQNWTQALW